MSFLGEPLCFGWFHPHPKTSNSCIKVANRSPNRALWRNCFKVRHRNGSAFHRDALGVCFFKGTCPSNWGSFFLVSLLIDARWDEVWHSRTALAGYGKHQSWPGMPFWGLRQTPLCGIRFEHRASSTQPGRTSTCTAFPCPFQEPHIVYTAVRFVQKLVLEWPALYHGVHNS